MSQLIQTHHLQFKSFMTKKGREHKGQMKWERETSENCDQDNAIKNPSSVHRIKRAMTGQRKRKSKKIGKKEDDKGIQMTLKKRRAATA